MVWQDRKFVGLALVTDQFKLNQCHQPMSLGKLHTLYKHRFYPGLVGMANEELAMDVPDTGCGRNLSQAMRGHAEVTNLQLYFIR